jgi:hypothetical protein
MTANVLPRLLLFTFCAVARAADNQPSPAANVDWEKVRAKPAKVTVINMKLAPLKVGTEKDGWLSVPERFLLHPTQIFKSTGPTNGVTDYKVTATGYLIMACNYDYQGNSSGNWQKEVWTAEKLRSAGWIEASEQELGGRLIDRGNRAQRIFVKHVAAGEDGRLRCNKYGPPFFILFGAAK